MQGFFPLADYFYIYTVSVSNTTLLAYQTFWIFKDLCVMEDNYLFTYIFLNVAYMTHVMLKNYKNITFLLIKPLKEKTRN